MRLLPLKLPVQGLPLLLLLDALSKWRRTATIKYARTELTVEIFSRFSQI